MNQKEIVDRINFFRKKKNAVILAHYYVDGEIQEIADFVGDSLALSQKAKDTKADIIVFAGVYFMAETAKILSPNKRVFLPDLESGCSLADSCTYEKFSDLKKQYPDHCVVSYVNTSALIKSLTDICCTSSNALRVIKSIDPSKPILFAPDKNLGNYLKQVSGRDNMLIFDGACHVHEEFSIERIAELKEKYPNAKVLAHPECKKTLLIFADKIGSTSELLEFSITDKSQEYIVATESGILHQMRKKSPQKTFIPAPPIDSSCGCNDCSFMKLNSLQKILDVLENEKNEIFVEPKIAKLALKSIIRMLEIN